MMALNRYRLRHLAKGQHKGAKRAAELLERPDRLIGLILFGNNFVNIVASMLAAFVAWRIMGEPGKNAERTMRTMSAPKPARVGWTTAKRSNV